MSALSPASRHLAYSLAAAVAVAGCGSAWPREPLAPALASAMSQSATSPSATSVESPFRGTVQAVEVPDINEETLVATTRIEGSGTATHLGRYTLVSILVLDLRTLAGTEQITLTAANGDVFRATASAQGTEVDPGVTITTLEIATITGGTGRFAGASGGYQLRRTLSEATGASTGSFVGTIRLVH